MTCNKYHHGNVVLLGDSAHSMLATYGQGANAALESAVELARSVESTGDSPAAAAAHFTAARAPDTHVIVNMSRHAMTGTRPGLSILYWLEFCLLQAQHWVVPKALAPPPLVTMAESTAPYRTLRNRTVVAKAVLYLGLASVGVAAALGSHVAVAGGLPG